ncbi:hypothetical protein HEP87_57760 [Streptomyces sp. S1D4-11]
MTFHEAGQPSVHLADLLGELSDPGCQQAQRDPGGLQHRLLACPLVTARVGEPRTGTEEFGIAQVSQLFPQGGIGGDDHGLELVDGLGAGFHGRRLRELVHPGDLHRPVARFGPSTGPPAQHGSRRILGIERIRLAAPTAICPVHPVHVKHVHALGQQVARQGRPVEPVPSTPARLTAPDLLAHFSRAR